MDPKTTIEKLRFLLPHWIEHNQNHEAEFAKWAAAARTEGSENLAGLLEQAAARLADADALLKKTLVQAGGSAHSHPHHHTD